MKHYCLSKDEQFGDFRKYSIKQPDYDNPAILFNYTFEYSFKRYNSATKPLKRNLTISKIYKTISKKNSF